MTFPACLFPHSGTARPVRYGLLAATPRDTVSACLEISRNQLAEVGVKEHLAPFSLALTLIAIPCFAQSQTPSPAGRGPKCGSERWAVKTLSDPNESTVDFTPVSQKVAGLVAIAPPTGDSETSKPAPGTLAAAWPSGTLNVLSGNASRIWRAADDGGVSRLLAAARCSRNDAEPFIQIGEKPAS